MTSPFPKRLLSIDDNVDNTLLIEMALQLTTEWTVSTAHSAHRGILKSLEQPFDAILLDRQMPELDGIETLHRLRQHPATKSIPVVFITAAPDSMPNLKSSELCVKGILPKPFDVYRTHLKSLDVYVTIEKDVKAKENELLKQSDR